MLKTIIIFYLIYFVWLNFPTMYLHRSLSHRQVEFSPWLAYFTKFIMWTRTRRYDQSFEKWYVAVHIEHHKHTDVPEDPHSPLYLSARNITFNNIRFNKTPEEINELTKDRKFNRSRLDEFFEKYPYGPWVFLVLLFLIFSYSGIVLWIIIWTTVDLVDGYFNYISHRIGYSNHVGNQSRNILPIGIIYAGDDLHNNHHYDPGQKNLAEKWWEFDTGYWIFKFLALFKLTKFN